MFFSSQWDNGSDGFEWKSRYLAEKRNVALEYLGDVNKRVPIHDAVRQKTAVNKRALLNASEGSSEMFSGPTDDPTERFPDSLKAIEAMIEELVAEEYFSDSLEHVTPRDAGLLPEEFLSNSSSEAALLKKWMRIRQETAEYQSYASIPEAERTSWSAWYLRHVKSGSNDE